MMKLNKLIEMANLALKEPTIYKSGGWGKWTGTKFEFDCVCFIKAILWGWCGKHEGHGGAIYKSNGVPDITTEKMISICENVSTDFSNIQVGEIVWLKGHVGIYAGNGNVIEATKNRVFNVSGVIKSQIDNKGVRSYKGVKDGNVWKKHGFLPYVDYTNEQPMPTPQPSSFLPPKGYFAFGDTSPNIGKIASFMYKTFPAYTDKKALGDYYGKYIQASIKEFQRRTGLEADGCVGPITLAELEKYGFKY